MSICKGWVRKNGVADGVAKTKNRRFLGKIWRERRDSNPFQALIDIQGEY